MAKITTRDNPSKECYTEEDMSETEEYFQNASKQIANNLQPTGFTQDTERQDDGVTIGALPSEKSEYEEEFDNILLEAIDETLLSLGEPVKNTVYFHLSAEF